MPVAAGAQKLAGSSTWLRAKAGRARPRGLGEALGLTYTESIGMLRQKAKRSPRGALRRMGACGLGLCTAFGWLGAAHAQEAPPTKTSCAEAYESSQETRASGHLQEARTGLAFCAQTECPAFVQKDCARWLEEVDRELPSIVISVAGLDPEAARQASLKIDGVAVADALAGKAVSLNPGKHELTLESPGEPAVVRQIMAMQGVQNRAVEFRVGTAALEASAEPTLSLDQPGATASPLRSYAYVAWGVGAVGLGVFGVFGTLGRADAKSLKQDCPAVDPEGVADGVCLESDFEERKSSYQTKNLIADIGLITGIVAAAGGTVLFFMSAPKAPSSDTPSTAGLRLDLGPLRGGARASVAGAF
jgi:hypothetical protein